MKRELNQINMHDTLITRPAIPKLEQIEKRSRLCHANADPNLLFMLIKVCVRFFAPFVRSPLGWFFRGFVGVEERNERQATNKAALKPH